MHNSMHTMIFSRVLCEIIELVNHVYSPFQINANTAFKLEKTLENNLNKVWKITWSKIKKCVKKVQIHLNKFLKIR